ncbi:zinc finger protein with KRAB and SCAN domains 3 [Oreochromis niloticus]|uniref:zinc finger protein with KRAB and SCAN domains 3 n=1 Tax=Oreochromis niloticus TaxID=8128 RepID=UPI000DF4B519|nr:zinc finger protein with KRAB and SCAN domains 3-like [Oreochromis niloticus]
MHRGGKVDKKKGVTVQKEADAEEEIGVSEMVESTEVEERELSLSDLMSILQAHMGQQEDRKQGKKRQRFRSLEVRPDENPKELYARLKDLYRKLIQPKGKTNQEIGEIIILEQYLRMLSPELQVWIREHNPSSAAKAAELAEVFVAARRKGQSWTCSSNKMPKEGPKSAQMYHQRPVSADKTPAGKYHKPPLVSLRLNLCMGMR